LIRYIDMSVPAAYYLTERLSERGLHLACRLLRASARAASATGAKSRNAL
jgi:hypothetical protein